MQVAAGEPSPYRRGMDKPRVTLPKVLAVAVLGAGALEACSPQPSTSDAGPCPPGCFSPTQPDGGPELEPDGGPICFC